MIIQSLDLILSYLNGGFPESSSNIRQPRAHKSAVKSCPVFNRISGQTYSGVPQNVQVLFRWPIFFAKPKSTNLTYPRKLIGQTIGFSTMEIWKNPTLIISHQIFWLQITINNSPRVQIINCLNNTSDNEMRLTFVEWTLILNHCPNFTSKTSIQQQVNKLAIPKKRFLLRPISTRQKFEFHKDFYTSRFLENRKPIEKNCPKIMVELREIKVT